MVSTRQRDLPRLPRLDARVPEWPLHQLRSRSCPFCSSPNQPVLTRPDGLPVAHCSACACWYVEQVPSEDVIRHFYAGYYETHRPSNLSERAAFRMKRRAFWDGADDLRLRRLGMLSGGLKGKRVLEIGCGLGGFLLAAQAEGADVFGTEISPEAIEFVRTFLKIPVYDCSLPECLRHVGHVDAIVLADLIEHLSQPLAILEAAVEGLAEGGLLLIWTPNAGAAGYSLESARKWVAFCVDLEHLQYLSPGTVAYLSSVLGLRIEHLETVGFPGLQGISEPPSKRVSAGRELRELLFLLPRSPFLVRSVSAARSLRSAIGGRPDPRTGDYHLFTVLRKGDCPGSAKARAG